MCSTEYPELLEELDRLERKTPPAGEPLSPAQNDRICRMALGRISGGVPALSAQTQTEEQRKGAKNMETKKKTGRTLRRTVRISLIAAALICASAATVYAVGPQLIEMLGENIGFFQEAPSRQEVDDPLDAPRGSYGETRQALEAFNAPVGQSVTDNGITVTLDNISMDVSSMDIFLTVSGDEAIEAVQDLDDYGPMWSRFFGAGPNFYWPKINGKEIAQPDIEDWYLAEDGSLKLWRHYLLTEMPEGEEITVELSETERALGQPGAWRFTVTLDGASVRAGGMTAESGDYDMPEAVYPNFDGLGSTLTLGRDLGLKYLAFGPKGGVIRTETTETRQTGADGSAVYAYEGLAAGMLYITDDTGKELYTSSSTVFGGDAMNLTAPDPAAASLTLTPMRYRFANEDGSTSETRTITTEELKNGAKVPTSRYGGYTVANFSIRDGVISYDLIPYGWNPGNSSEILRPQDDGKISMVAEEATNLQDGSTATLLHSALLSSTFDPQTGVISERRDYYAATDEELSSITEWKYEYWDVEMDTEHAVTVELRDVK